MGGSAHSLMNCMQYSLERAKNMNRDDRVTLLLTESEDGSTQAKKRFKRLNVDELPDEEDDEEEQSEEEAETCSRKREVETNVSDKSSGETNGGADIQETLKAFFEQQQRINAQATNPNCRL